MQHPCRGVCVQQTTGGLGGDAAPLQRCMCAANNRWAGWGCSTPAEVYVCSKQQVGWVGMQHPCRGVCVQQTTGGLGGDAAPLQRCMCAANNRWAGWGCSTPAEVYVCSKQPVGWVGMQHPCRGVCVQQTTGGLGGDAAPLQRCMCAANNRWAGWGCSTPAEVYVCSKQPVGWVGMQHPCRGVCVQQTTGGLSGDAAPLQRCMCAANNRWAGWGCSTPAEVHVCSKQPVGWVGMQHPCRGVCVQQTTGGLGGDAAPLQRCMCAANNRWAGWGCSTPAEVYVCSKQPVGWVGMQHPCRGVCVQQTTGGLGGDAAPLQRCMCAANNRWAGWGCSTPAEVYVCSKQPVGWVGMQHPCRGVCVQQTTGGLGGDAAPLQRCMCAANNRWAGWGCSTPAEVYVCSKQPVGWVGMQHPCRGACVQQTTGGLGGDAAPLQRCMCAANNRWAGWGCSTPAEVHVCSKQPVGWVGMQHPCRGVCVQQTTGGLGGYAAPLQRCMCAANTGGLGGDAAPLQRCMCAANNRWAGWGCSTPAEVYVCSKQPVG